MSLVIPDRLSQQVLWPYTIRSLFHTEPFQAIVPDDTVLQLKAANVSHLTMQIFPSPAYSKVITPEQFKADWDRRVWPKLQWAKDNGFRVVACADETFRTAACREWIRSCPWAKNAVWYTAIRLNESGVVDCVEMVDESKHPSEYLPQPFVSWWREVYGPPIAWPNQAPFAWETDTLSDYSSRYAPFWKRGSLSLSEQAKLIKAAASGVRRDRPWLCLTWCCAGEVIDGRKVNSGVKPNHIPAQVWLALAYGASGVRMYGYDWSLWRNAREQHKSSYQTGSWPSDERWRGVVEAFRSVYLYERQLQQAVYEPVEKGPWLFGRRGNLVWAVNKSNQPQKHPVKNVLIPSGGVQFFYASDLQ